MSKRVLAISHQRDAGLGVFEDALAESGCETDTWHIAEGVGPPSDPLGYDAAIALGGAMHADQDDSHSWLRAEKELLASLLGRRTPVLGICLGAQLLAESAGGEARRASEPEIGWFGVSIEADGAEDPVLAPLAPGFEAFQWHSYECVPPPGATVLARSPVCAQAFRVGSGLGIQFHAEVSAADARRWTDDYQVDEDAVRIGLDPLALNAETDSKIAAFNDLGRALCGRWLAATAEAAERSGRAPRYSPVSGVRYAPESPPSTMKVVALT